MKTYEDYPLPGTLKIVNRRFVYDGSTVYYLSRLTPFGLLAWMHRVHPSATLGARGNADRRELAQELHGGRRQLRTMIAERTASHAKYLADLREGRAAAPWPIGRTYH